MNENITENMDEMEEQLDGLEGTESEEETGEATGEVSEDVEQSDETGTEGNGEEIQSEEQNGDGDSTALPAEELELLTEKVTEMQTYLVERDMSIFEKPLSKYTASEGLLLIVVLILTAEMIFKKIGGILRCEKE